MLTQLRQFQSHLVGFKLFACCCLWAKDAHTGSISHVPRPRPPPVPNAYTMNHKGHLTGPKPVDSVDGTYSVPPRQLPPASIR